ncbi:MAG TPA: phosphoenolpyruvate carboxylase [Candidatus Binataceae bacterium]|nr:phosphoenolpyruvate carboxylase [Candidatus Binataceae bacterium]
MASFGTQPVANGANTPSTADIVMIGSIMNRVRAQAAADPFSNPILLFALELTLRIDRGDVTLDALDNLVQRLTVEAFADRAERLGSYLGETHIAANEQAIAALIEQKAQAATFGEFRALLGRNLFGVVFTAHPTFSIVQELAHSLVELATGQSADGVALNQVGCDERLAVAMSSAHRPPEELSLEVEHAWVTEALNHAHNALEGIHRTALRVARKHWPEEWTSLGPRLVTLASWVGYDQDGRTDVTWTRTIAARLADKLGMIERHRHRIDALIGTASGDFLNALAPLGVMLNTASATVAAQLQLVREAECDRAKTAAFARAMAAGREQAMVETAPIVRLIDAALQSAPSDQPREDLLVMRASLQTHGLGLGHIHVRLNSSQLHNAARRLVGLETEPNDPANRRSYFNTINDLLGRVQPLAISFGSMIEERASAKRLMMTVAQIVKFIDGETPIRFLIAETETGFTLLAALYYARLFGVEDRIEISPLFETEEAFERGERVIEEALKSPHYRSYLERQGRMAVQFGFSDSGRFIGQMAATFRIERLRLRLAQLLERHGLGRLEVILFNTHGESIGRGGHPQSLADRLRYAAPPMSRSEFERRGLQVKEEVSFQGGDGYLPFMTPAAAAATMRQILAFALDVSDETRNDPIYAAPDYAAEFFATVQQEFTNLVDNPDYAALLGLFGTNLLYRTGSRPVAREAEEWGRPATIKHPAQLRAIPNNAILQQLGFMANTLHGIGRAVAKDPEMFQAMRERSPRFRRALQMVNAALDRTELDVLRAYVNTVNPAMWLNGAGRTRRPARAKALRELTRLTERLDCHDRLARLVRCLQADQLWLLEAVAPVESPQRRRLILLHGIRIALIQRICLLATEIPHFSPQLGVTRDDILARILALDVPSAVERLRRIFPHEDGTPDLREDFGERSEYRPEPSLSYAIENDALFGPMLRLYDLARRIGTAITYEIGAIG